MNNGQRASIPIYPLRSIYWDIAPIYKIQKRTWDANVRKVKHIKKGGVK